MVNVVGIRGQTGLQLGDAELIGLSRAQMHGFVKQIVSDRLRGIARYARRHTVCHNVEHQRQHRAQKHNATPDPDGSQIGILGIGRNDHVQHMREDIRQRKLGHRAGYLDEKSDHQSEPKRS